MSIPVGNRTSQVPKDFDVSSLRCRGNRSTNEQIVLDGERTLGSGYYRPENDLELGFG
jgi:hypothetical protein